MKIGIAIKVNVSKIDKNRLFKGEKGTYLDCTTFIDTENPGQFEDHGFISQDVSREERDQGVKGNILGNCKVFYKRVTSQNTGQSQERQQEYYTENGGNQQPEPLDDFEDIPF